MVGPPQLRVPIKKPHEHGDEYINRKGVASPDHMQCQEEFTSLDVSWPGSVHDSRIWKNSDASRVL